MAAGTPLTNLTLGATSIADDLSYAALAAREIRRLLAGTLARPATPPGHAARPRRPATPPGHAARWLEWRRRHQARSRWFHKRARLQPNYALVS